MNTFLPYSDFAESAKCLDNKRLNKQKVEVYQMLKALNGETKGWVNHPCTLMWKGYENALIEYGLVICQECIRRGFKDTCSNKITQYTKSGGIVMPWWLGIDKVHQSHRSNLYRKDSVYYETFDEPFEKGLPYCWPIELDDQKLLRYKHVGEKKYTIEVYNG